MEEEEEEGGTGVRPELQLLLVLAPTLGGGEGRGRGLDLLLLLLLCRILLLLLLLLLPLLRGRVLDLTLQRVAQPAVLLNDAAQLLPLALSGWYDTDLFVVILGAHITAASLF